MDLECWMQCYRKDLDLHIIFNESWMLNAMLPQRFRFAGDLHIIFNGSWMLNAILQRFRFAYHIQWILNIECNFTTKILIWWRFAYHIQWILNVECNVAAKILICWKFAYHIHWMLNATLPQRFWFDGDLHIIFNGSWTLNAMLLQI